MTPPGSGSGRALRRGIGEGWLLSLAALLALCAAGILVADARAQPEEAQISREFQSLVHGTGFGPAADPSGCAFAFDPRLAGQCPREPGLIPLGAGICPYHSLSVFAYPSDRTGDGNTHAHLHSQNRRDRDAAPPAAQSGQHRVSPERAGALPDGHRTVAGA